MLGDFACHAGRYAKHASGLMVRRERTELVDTIERSRQVYGPLGAQFHEQDKLWRFPGGARLRFAYLENDSDAESYQGHAYTRVYVEELGNFPNQAPVMKLMATLRSAAGVPVGFRATGNPGGPGHHWVKARYIDPAPMGMQLITSEFTNPFNGRKVTRDRVYIPARLSDNPFLGEDYVATLAMSGSDELVRAWLEGDWTVITGAFFPEFNTARHVIAPFEIPKHWLRYRSADWGSARPFAVHWWAVSDGELAAIPRGAIVCYREWYGMKPGQPNTGVKLTAEEVADGILDRQADGETIGMSVIDPAAFASDGGPSIAERMAGRKVHFHPADNKRVGKLGALGGWDLLRHRLKGEDGRPMIYFFSTCVHTIRTLPAMQHDEKRPEDLDCWVAGTPIATPGGERAIETIQAGDVVETPIGPRRVLRSYLSGASQTVRVTLSDGRVIEGTPHHRIYIHGRGLVPLDSVECHDIPKQRNISWRARKPLFIAASLTRAIQVGCITTLTGLRSLAALPVCIARSGLMQGARFLPAGMFITSAATTTTTGSRISNACRREFMGGTITGSGYGATLGSGYGSGVNLQKENERFDKMLERWSRELRRGELRAAIVSVYLLLDTLRSGIARLAAPRQWPVIGRLAKFVVRSFGSSSTPRNKSAPVHIVAVGRYAERTPVYNLTVEGAHLFYADGVLSSNTDSEDHAVDSVRYACAARPWVREAPKPAPVKFAQSTQMTVTELIEQRRRARIGDD